MAYPCDVEPLLTYAKLMEYDVDGFPKYNHIATTAPSATDDETANYGVGSVWIDVTHGNIYMCTDPTEDTAVWEVLNNPTVPLNNLAATVAPVFGDDTADGYSVGSVWVDVTADNVYMCTDATAGAAVWLKLNNATVPLNNLGAAVDPTVSDDILDGYSTGSLWVNTTTPAAFICITAAEGAADWDKITPVA